MIFLEREDGYIILDFLRVAQHIPRDKGGEILKFYKGQELYFKDCSESLAISQLFCTYVLRALEIPTVSLDMARYQSYKGIVSTSYNPHHLKEFSLKNILDKYFLEVVLKRKHKSYIQKSYDLYNLEDIYQALCYFFRNDLNNEAIVSSLMQDIVKLFFCQFLLGDYDMHYRNLIVLKDSSFHLAPFFDFDGSFCLDLNSTRYVVALENYGHDSRKRRKPIEVLEESIPKYYELFKELFVLIPTKTEVLNDIEKSLGKKLHPNTIRHICYDEYIAQIDNMLKMYEKHFLKK